MHAVYLACLVGGSVATVLFAALGALGGVSGHLHVGAGHAGAHLHAGPTHAGHLASSAPTHGHALPPAAPGHGGAVHAAHAPAAHGHGGAHAHTVEAVTTHSWLSSALGWSLSWFSPLTLAAAALWFGGAGLVAEGALHGVAIVIAVVAAILGAAAVRALMAAFVRSSTPPLQESAVGALGTINAPVRADAAGEVIYTLEGLRRSAAARSLDGRPIPRGASVVIVRRERGIAWVTPLDPLASLEQDVASARHGDLSPPP